MCPSALAGFKGAAALLPVGVGIRLDIHFVCPPPIRPMAFPMTPAHGREREVPLSFHRKRPGEVNGKSTALPQKKAKVLQRGRGENHSKKTARLARVFLSLPGRQWVGFGKGKGIEARAKPEKNAYRTVSEP